MFGARDAFRIDPSKPWRLPKAVAYLMIGAEPVHFTVRSESYSNRIMTIRLAKFSIGQVVRHRLLPFRGVIYDVDPEFNNTEDWWLAIPEAARPRKDQPFYHLLAENDSGAYTAYVSEQNLLLDDSGLPVGHPQATLMFDGFRDGQYNLRAHVTH